MATMSVVPFRIFVREDLKRGKHCAYYHRASKNKGITVPSSPRLAPRQRIELSKGPKASQPASSALFAKEHRLTTIPWLFFDTR